MGDSFDFVKFVANNQLYEKTKNILPKQDITTLDVLQGLSVDDINF